MGLSYTFGKLNCYFLLTILLPRKKSKYGFFFFFKKEVILSTVIGLRTIFMKSWLGKLAAPGLEEQREPIVFERPMRLFIVTGGPWLSVSFKVTMSGSFAEEVPEEWPCVITMSWTLREFIFIEYHCTYEKVEDEGKFYKFWCLKAKDVYFF